MVSVARPLGSRSIPLSPAATSRGRSAPHWTGRSRQRADNIRVFPSTLPLSDRLVQLAVPPSTANVSAASPCGVIPRTSTFDREPVRAQCRHLVGLGDPAAQRLRMAIGDSPVGKVPAPHVAMLAGVGHHQIMRRVGGGFEQLILGQGCRNQRDRHHGEQAASNPDFANFPIEGRAVLAVAGMDAMAIRSEPGKVGGFCCPVPPVPLESPSVARWGPTALLS